MAASAVQRLLQSGGTTGLLELRYDGKSQVALVKEIQTDPARGTPLHVDFHAVALDQEVQVAVPLGVLSEEMRTRDGGIISLNLRELSVYCLPTQIPESISIDVSGLGIGDTITQGSCRCPRECALRAPRTKSSSQWSHRSVNRSPPRRQRRSPTPRKRRRCGG